MAQTGDICDKSEEKVSCKECGQSTLLRKKKPADICERCVQAMESRVHGYDAPLNTAKIDETTPPSALALDGVKSTDNVAEVDSLIEEVRMNHSALERQLKATLASYRLLLDQKEANLLASYKANFDHKVNLLTCYKEEQTVNPSDTRPFPKLSGGTLCGFIPDMTNLIHLTACLLLEHRKEVEQGEEMSVSVIGSISKEGLFWLRILPDVDGLQDVMLENISNAIGMELSVTAFCPLQSPNKGDVCCALYSQDQRWYRGLVVDIIERKKEARVYFLDYGNTETISYSDLSYLHPKFRVYPFQMIQCCFSTDPKLLYEREVRWKFTDMTHGSELTVKILKHLPDNTLGRLHLVQLINCSGKEGFDVGASIITMAGTAPAQPSSIKYRDIRYANKPPVQHVISTTSVQSLSPRQPEATPISAVAKTGRKVDEEPDKTINAVTSSSSSFVSSTFSKENLNGSGSSMDQNLPPSQDVQGSRTPTEDSEKLAETGQMGSLPEVGKGVQRSPLAGDEANVGEEEMLLGDNDMIASAAQIKVSLSLPTETAARSVSGSPIPIPAAPKEVSIVEPNLVSSETVSTGMDHPVLKKGSELTVYVTTPLCADGSFWVQLTSVNRLPFLKMVETLQRCCEDEPPTPVFFSPGDLCTAQFSEDNCWYRARVEEVTKEEFLVRYLDFGNKETRGREFLMALKSEFREIPFQAFHCTIACPDHMEFSKKEIEHFSELTFSRELVARILGVKGAVASVQLFLHVSGTLVDLNDEIYTADVKFGESLNFSLKKSQLYKLKSSTDSEPFLSMKEVTTSTNWADFMDDLESPHNDGIFTLPRQEDSQTPTPTPTPIQLSPSPQPHQNSRSTTPSSHTSSSSSSRLQSRSRTSSPHSNVNSTREKDVFSKGTSTSPRNPIPQTTSVSRSSSVPRIQSNALGMVRKSLLMAEKAWEKKERASSDQPHLQHQDDVAAKSSITVTAPDADTSVISSTSSSSSCSSPAAPPGLPQPKGIRSINQISRNGTSFPPIGRRRKSPEPDSSQIMDKEGGQNAIQGLNGNLLSGSPKPLSVQQYKVTSVQSPEQAEFDKLPSHVSTRLFVKNVPLDRSMEEVRGMFAQYGKVIGLVPVPSRKNVIYLYMDPDGAQRAINNLYGKAIAKRSKPLIVEVSMPSRKVRPPPPPSSHTFT